MRLSNNKNPAHRPSFFVALWLALALRLPIFMSLCGFGGVESMRFSAASARAVVSSGVYDFSALSLLIGLEYHGQEGTQAQGTTAVGSEILA